MTTTIDNTCDFSVHRVVLKRCFKVAFITLNVVYLLAIDSCDTTPELVVGRGFRATFAAAGLPRKFDSYWSVKFIPKKSSSGIPGLGDVRPIAIGPLWGSLRLRDVSADLVRF